MQSDQGDRAGAADDGIDADVATRPPASTSLPRACRPLARLAMLG